MQIVSELKYRTKEGRDVNSSFALNQIFESPRSGRQRKAWGVSPRSSGKMSIEPAKRVIAETLNMSPARGLLIILGS